MHIYVCDACMNAYLHVCKNIHIEYIRHGLITLLYQKKKIPNHLISAIKTLLHIKTNKIIKKKKMVLKGETTFLNHTHSPMSITSPSNLSKLIQTTTRTDLF